MCAPSTEKLAVTGIALDAVVHRIDHIQISLAIKRHPSRSIELAIATPGLAPFAEKLTVFVKNRDTIQRLIRHVEIFRLIDHDTNRPTKFPIVRAGAANRT